MMDHRIVLSIVLSASILLVGCGITRIREEDPADVSESMAAAQTTGSQESTAATEATPTPTSKPTPTPTSEPTPTSTPSPTPTPLPQSANIPRETLPDGQLFDEKYYAVLPGEGNDYWVYDCYGEIIHTFSYTDDFYEPLPIGLFEKQKIEKYTILPADKPESPSPENRSYFPGGYCEWPTYELNEPSDEYLRIVTDKGETIRIPRNPEESSYFEWKRVERPDSTGIFISEDIWMEDNSFLRHHYVEISKDGAVIQNLFLDRMPYWPIQTVGEKYYIISSYNEYGEEIASLMDLSGKTVLDKVIPVSPDYTETSYQTWITIGDYFIWNGKTFDAELKIVPDETRTPDGLLIPGVRYNVDGVICQNEISLANNYLDTLYSYAVGTDGSSKIAIKSIWGDCVIRDVDPGSVRVLDVSPTMVLLSDYSLYSLKTGEFLRNANIEERSIDINYLLTDRYLIFSYNYPDWEQVLLYKRFYIFDEYGNLRYYSKKTQAGPAADDLIFLKRGPYIGLADLNGEWVLKTVDPDVKRDADEPVYG
jgi:hypothetical protein